MVAGMTTKQEMLMAYIRVLERLNDLQTQVTELTERVKVLESRPRQTGPPKRATR
jgi:hypothetical protein